MAQIFGAAELMEDVHNRELCIGCGGCVDLCPYFRNYKGRTSQLFPCTLEQGRCFAYCPKAEVDLNELTRKIRRVDYDGSPLGVYRKVLCNTRSIHAIGVISGEQQYPDLADIKSWVAELSQAAWFMDATDKALELGNPILGNIMMIGAAAGIGALPLAREDFAAAIAENLSADKQELNLKAYDMGVGMVQ
jgi:ferredoxin